MERGPFSCQILHGTSVDKMLVGPDKRKAEKTKLEPCFPRKQTQGRLSHYSTYINYFGRAEAECSSGHGSEGGGVVS